MRFARLLCVIGEYNKSLKLAELISRDAEAKGDLKTKLEADLILTESLDETAMDKALYILKQVIDKSLQHGFDDLVIRSQLLITKIYLNKGDIFSAEEWLKKVTSNSKFSNKNVVIEKELLKADILRHQGDYDTAIELLMKNESNATNSGLIHLALDASVILCEIYCTGQRFDRCGDIFQRAILLRNKLINALHKNASLETYISQRIFKRLEYIEKQIKNRKLVGI
jgi:tetratricopeptide (TPR) repeat protein